MPKLNRIKDNPIIEPIKDHKWEAKATFNPTAINLNGRIHLIYRAMGEDNVSVFGYASSENGVDFDERLDRPIYVPRSEFEFKKDPINNSGCEDPRITQFGKVLYMCYTAYDGINPPRVALTSISVNDFLNKKWNWKMPVLISCPNAKDKDACILPEKFDDKFVFFHRLGGKGIVIDLLNNLEFKNSKFLEGKLCIPNRNNSWDSERIGISTTPIKTKKGWLLLYHGVSKLDNQYRVGAMLLDLKNPTKVIYRTKDPLLEPETEYEKNGVVNNVVFPCGAVLIKNELMVYYGGADRVVGAASGKIDEIIDQW